MTKQTGGLAILMAFTIGGCAPKGSGASPRAFDPQAMTFQGALTPREQERCREAWAFYLARFERDERAIQWRSLTIVAGDEVRPGVGGEVRPGRHVFIATEAEETCASSYHEMAHLLLMDEGGDGDPGHADPRWPGWSVRQQRAVIDLIDDRIARNGDSNR